MHFLYSLLTEVEGLPPRLLLPPLLLLPLLFLVLALLPQRVVDRVNRPIRSPRWMRKPSLPHLPRHLLPRQNLRLLILAQNQPLLPPLRIRGVQSLPLLHPREKKRLLNSEPS